MEAPFVIIDSFVVTEELAPQLDGLALGKWYVLEGTFVSTAELPSPGSWVELRLPSGQSHHVIVMGCEVRHGSGALSFLEPDMRVPRLSQVRRVPS